MSRYRGGRGYNRDDPEGVLIGIDNDSYPDNCQIKTKRVDGQWSDWNSFEEDNSTDWYEARERNCSTKLSHGGLQTCLAGSKQIQYLRWFKWVKTKIKNFFQAQTFCEDVSGQLFHYFGSDLVPGFPFWSEQILFLMRHMMSNESASENKLNDFWIGYRSGTNHMNELEVYDIRGERAQKIEEFWNTDYGIGDVCIVILGRQSNYEYDPMLKVVQDLLCNYQRNFVCFINNLTITVVENMNPD